MSPERIGPYRIERELGRGAYGAVFLATRDGLAREVALKVLLPGADATAQARFQQEARLASQLEHPNVVRCSDLGRDSQRGLLYLALDYVTGGNLKDRLREGPLEPAEAGRIMIEVCRGLAHAHERNVLHRDLKPENVLLDAAGRAQVTDFGLARDLSAGRLTAEGTIVGTPNYFPPETLSGGAADARGDVYAVGLLLYECLSGRRAFPGNDFMEVTSLIRTGRYAPLKRQAAPLALVAVCERALALDPARRYADAGELGAALEAALAPSAPPASTGPRPLVVALGLLVLFLAATGGTLGVLLALDRPAAQATEDERGERVAAGSPGDPARVQTPALGTSDEGPATPAPLSAAETRALEVERRAEREAEAAARRVEEAIEEWDFVAAERELSSSGEARTRLEHRLRSARASEVEAAQEVRRLQLTELAALDAYQRLEGSLVRRPRSAALLMLRAELLIWLGCPQGASGAIGAAGQGAASPRLDALRELNQQNVALGAPELSLKDALHETWDAYRGAAWSWDPETGLALGRGQGLGIYGLSGLLSKESGRLRGRFALEAELRFEPERGGYAGLQVLQQAQDGLLIYLYDDPGSVCRALRLSLDQVRERFGGSVPLGLRVAYLVNGEWRPFAEDQLFRRGEAEWHHLAAEVAPDVIRIRVDGEEAQPIRLPRAVEGRVGLLKWFDQTVSFRGFKAGALQ